MLYLIHDEQRKKITDDYYICVWLSLSWALVIVFVIAAVSAIPTIVLLQTEVSVSRDRVAQLKAEIQASDSTGSEAEALKITNKINLLEQKAPVDVRKVYADITRITESVSGVRITGITVDSLSKSVQIVTQVRDKEVAKNLVDALKKTTYKGAELPYSVLSERASFTFAQNLTYE